jgi:hypothetical protein
MNMIQSLIEALNNKLPEHITIDSRHFLLEKSEESFEYKEIAPDAPKKKEQVREVSTIESLASVIKHTMSIESTDAYKEFEIALDDKGATFYPNFRHAHRHEYVRYNRCKSQQWEALLKVLGADFSHGKFIKELRRLRPSILNYEDFYSQWASITISDDNCFVSDPDITTNGSGSVSAKMRVKIQNTNAESDVQLPFSFVLEMPLVRGSKQLYRFEAVIDAKGIPNDKGSRDWKFSIHVPELGITKDQLLQDEADYIHEQFMEHSPLVIMNYTQSC